MIYKGRKQTPSKDNINTYIKSQFIKYTNETDKMLYNNL